jgi:hypothetical protein
MIIVNPDDIAWLHLIAEHGKVRMVELVQLPDLFLTQQAVVGGPDIKYKKKFRWKILSMFASRILLLWLQL